MRTFFRTHHFIRLTAVYILLLGGCSLLPSKPTPQQESPASLSSPMPAPSLTPAPTPSEFTLVAGGDVLPGCWLDSYLERHGHDYPYTAIAPIFQSANIGLVNLECPLSRRGLRYRKKKFTFRAHPAAAAALFRAGINAVSLANNHMLDFGPTALFDTREALDQAGVAYAGAGANLSEARRPAGIYIPGGGFVALLSYSLTYPSAFWATTKSPGTALARMPYLQADVSAAAAWADLVVVCFHWSGELVTHPRAYQLQYGHAAIDAGAQLVIGTHPHILQGMEWYNNGLIVYSLGNLAFGGGRSRRAIHSALVKISFDKAGNLLAAWTMPLTVDNLATQFVPAPLSGPPAEVVLQMLRRRSQAWGTRFLMEDSGWARILRP